MKIMNWLVGVDLGASSQGALKVVDWLHARTNGLTHRFTAAHVIEQRWLANADYPGVGPETERAREVIRSSLGAAHVRGSIQGVEILHGHDAAAALASRSEGPGWGVIIGRAGRAEGWSFVNLGSTARRLLRTSTGPVCVVPPDLDRDRLDPGPVLVAVRPDDSCLDALRFAATLGRDLGRPVVGVHAVAVPAAYPTTDVALAVAPLLPGTVNLERLEEVAREGVTRWAKERDIELPEMRFGVGPAAQVVTEIADDADACTIVCAARNLSPLQRIIHSSVATDLAAHAALPVVVVPEP